METKEQKVRGREETTIAYTGKSKFHRAGETAVVHRIQAEKLISKGVAKPYEDNQEKKSKK